jgi:hypothetical protein
MADREEKRTARNRNLFTRMAATPTKAQIKSTSKSATQSILPQRRTFRVLSEELTGAWQTATMPIGRHMGHRGPSIADKARTARAVAQAVHLAPIIAELRAAGITSLNGIAAALDERHVPTPAGSPHWHPAQVSRLLKRLAG